MGFAKAAAALLKGVAPRVQDTYSNAANADAGYAHGLGSNVQQSIQQQADANNAFLAKMGTPSAGLEHPADVGGTAYGLEGYIPATTLQREGAAFGSAAQTLPGDVLSQGQQQASATLSSDPNLASLQGDLAKLAATQPAVYQKTLTSLEDMGYKKAELGLSAKRLQISAQQGQERINISAQRAAQSAYNENRNYRLSLARLGIAKKSLQLRALKSEAKNSGAGGGFTPDELVHIRGQAGNIAMHAHDGIPASGTKAALPPLNYKQAMKQEILAGIPPSIAVKALQDAGYQIPLKASDFTFPGAGIQGQGSEFGSLKGPAVLVRSLRNYPNLDANAVMAIASQEGLSGGVGDHGTSFGPFQMHAGGALPARVWAKGARYAQKWAWSPAGINYALRRIEAVAGGLQGHAAIAAISRGFERPADPAQEIAGASSVYGRY